MTTEVTESAIVKKIMAMLKLDEAGKINKFFKKEIKAFQNEIRDINNLLIAEKARYEATLDKLRDSIEDAKENVIAAYHSITLENVVNNEAMQQFSSTYWKKINQAEATVERLEKDVKRVDEAYEEEVKTYKAKIAKIEERIAIITK